MLRGTTMVRGKFPAVSSWNPTKAKTVVAGPSKSYRRARDGSRNRNFILVMVVEYVVLISKRNKRIENRSSKCRW